MSEQERCPKCGAERVEYNWHDPRWKHDNWACGTYRRGGKVYATTYCDLRIAEVEVEQLRSRLQRTEAVVEAARVLWSKVALGKSYKPDLLIRFATPYEEMMALGQALADLEVGK